MRLLLDTHAFLWFAAGDPRLSQAALNAISDGANEVFFSPASYWEMCLKIGRGKLLLQQGWMNWLPRMVSQRQMQWLPIEPRHCEATLHLQPIHGDPFDRMLVAQAQTEGLTLVTADHAVRSYPVQVLW